MNHRTTHKLSLRPLRLAFCLAVAWPALAQNSNDVLTLDRVMQMAVADSPTLAAAAARLQQAAARVQQARSAYWPAITGSASYRDTTLSDRQAAIPGLADSDGASYAASLGAEWLVFDGFTRRFQNLQALQGEAQLAELAADVRRQLLGAVAAAYHGAQLARARMAIEEADTAFNLEQLREAKLEVEAGSRSVSDALNFEIRANEARSARIRAEADYTTALSALAALVGLSDATFPADTELAPLVDETADELSAPDVNSLIADAVARRPDLIAADRAVDQADAGVRSARGSYWPTVAVNAAYEGSREDDPSFGSEDFGHQVGAALTYNFSDGGARRGRLREAEGQLTEAEAGREAARLTVADDVRAAVAALQQAQAQLSLQRENTALVERNRDLVEKAYEAGQASLVRFNEAQNNLVRSRNELVLALVSLRSAQASLETATGAIVDRVAESGDGAAK